MHRNIITGAIIIGLSLVLFFPTVTRGMAGFVLGIGMGLIVGTIQPKE